MKRQEGIINTEDIRILFPNPLLLSIKRDAESFEVLSKSGESINLNRFLSSLISGFYREYQEENAGRHDRLLALIDPYVPEKRKKTELLEKLIREESAETERSNPPGPGRKISLRPTKETDQIILEIREGLRGGETLAGYFRGMFLAYVKRPIYERERIIFRKTSDFLEEACRTRRAVVFTTRDNPGFLHRVIPFDLAYGPDEMYNYLLCQESSAQGKPLPTSFRLCRIINPRFAVGKAEMDRETEQFLRKMKQYGPQFPFNQDIETCILLTETGRDTYRQIYQGRPVPDRKEDPDDQGNTLWYFRCSQTQLYQYFRKFNPGEARVIAPESLKNSLRRFYKRQLEYLE